MYIDWDQLRSRASELAKLAYAPYSNYPVGAAGLVDDGRIVGGCNVENACYGVGLCAECGLISELIGGGGGRLLAFVCVNKLAQVIMPCGRCRQLLFEHGGEFMKIQTPNGVFNFGEMLPQAFGPAELIQLIGEK